MSRLTEFFVGFRHLKKDFRPYGIPKVHFIKSEWEDLDEPQRISCAYLAWRGLFALFCIFAVSFSIAVDDHRKLWLIFLTRWTLTSQTIYGLLFFLSSILQRARQGGGGEKAAPGPDPAPGTKLNGGAGGVSASQRQVVGTGDEPIGGQGVQQKSGAAAGVRDDTAGVAAGGEKVKKEEEEEEENKGMSGGHEEKRKELTEELLKDKNKEEEVLTLIVQSSPALLLPAYERNDPLESVIWLLHPLAGSLPMFVTLGYWIVIFPGGDESHDPLPLTANCLLHGVNGLFCFVDLLIISIPVRVTHAPILILFVLTYALFGGLYEVAGGPYPEPDKPYIYPIMNWHEKPNETIIHVGLGMLAITLLYLLLWLLYVLRLFLVSKLSRRKDKDSVHVLHQYWLRDQ